MPVTEEQNTTFEVRRGAIKAMQPPAEEIEQPSGEEQQPIQEALQEKEEPEHEQQGEDGAVQAYVEKLQEAVQA